MTSASDGTVSPFEFLSLPLEIREIIYFLILRSRFDAHIEPQNDYRPLIKLSHGRQLRTALSQTNTQVKEEMLKVLGTNFFITFSTAKSLRNFPPRALACITHAGIKLRCSIQFKRNTNNKPGRAQPWTMNSISGVLGLITTALPRLEHLDLLLEPEPHQDRLMGRTGNHGADQLRNAMVNLIVGRLQPLVDAKFKRVGLWIRPRAVLRQENFVVLGLKGEGGVPGYWDVSIAACKKCHWREMCERCKVGAPLMLPPSPL